MRVIGTAGHVDHGKSTLVQALTGINPDRLAEEQARQMTIDLGFAWLQLPDGETVGVVDVPGHEDFIENMLAGVGGIDAALLIIAADEGVMPQTREHLAILDLLAIPRLVTALTKIDAVDDPEWRDLVMLDIEEVLSGTRFTGAPIVPVSAHTGEGLQTLVATLAALLAALDPKAAVGLPRLPIDRVFTLSGLGTVVTGTLLDGALRVGETVELQPSGRQARIRGLQSHNRSIDVALPGSRTAVNLSGVDKDEVQRGDMLTASGWLRPTLLMDVELEHLATGRPLKHNAGVKVFAGTSEALARVRLLDAEALAPGTVGWAQLQLEAPMPVIRGQRFIVRIPSPSETIGGGVILDTAPGRKWRRRHPGVLARFERLARGAPVDLVSEQLIQARQPLTRAELLKRTALTAATLDALHDDDLIRSGEWIVHRETLAQYRQVIERHLAKFHQTEPLRQGMQLDSLRARLKLPPDGFEVILQLLAGQGALKLIMSGLVALPGFSVHYTRAQQAAVEKTLRDFRTSPYTPPSVKEVTVEVGEAILSALIGQGDLVKLNDEVLLSAGVYREWLDYAYKRLNAGEGLRVSEFRDTFNTSRKYALAFLDHLEANHLTRRVDDQHVLAGGDWSRFLGSSD